MSRATLRTLLPLSACALLVALGWGLLNAPRWPVPSAAQQTMYLAAQPHELASKKAPTEAHAAQPGVADAPQPQASVALSTTSEGDGPSTRARKAAPEVGSAGSNAMADTQRARGTAREDTQDDAGTPRKAVRHKLDRAGIQNAVRSVLPEIRECYDGWLKVGPSLAGTLQVHMTIEPDPDDPSHAVVTSSRVLDTELEHAALEGCLLNALSEPMFELPTDSGKVEVTYPFQFDPREPSTP